MKTGSCQQPSGAGENTRGNVCSSVSRRSCLGRIPATHTALINRSFSAGYHTICAKTHRSIREKKEVLLSYSTSSQDEKCGRDLLILQRGNPRAELDWFAMQRLQICRTKLWSNKYRWFPGCRCFDYLQITTGLTSVSMFGLSTSPLFWLLALFLSFWKHTDSKIKAAKTETAVR